MLFSDLVDSLFLLMSTIIIVLLADIKQSDSIASLHYQIKNCDDILAVSLVTM